jgi:penicillin amidase
VRISRHGPLVSDAINANNAGHSLSTPLEPLALRWTALDPDDTTLAAILDVNAARDWSSFTQALRQFVAPSQNFVFADTSGHIGYYTPGRVPVRATGDGSRPVDGWTGESEWTEWIRFEDLPHVLDPPERFLVTANQRQAPATYPFDLGMDWQEPLRAARVTELLRAKDRFAPDDFARMQSDTVSMQARRLLPVFLSRVTPKTTEERQAVSLLREWSLDARGDSVAAAIFAAWLQHIVPAITADDLGPRLGVNYQERFSSVTRFLEETLASDNSAWCDNVTTAPTETCADTATRALTSALEDVAARLGDDLATWRWDRLHRTVFAHQGLDAVRFMRPWLSRSIPNGGDWSSINIGTPSVNQPYDQRTVAGYRSIVDLSPMDDSRFIIDLGQSGNVMSRRYDDFLQDWGAVKHRKMRTKKEDIEDDALGRLRLTPREQRTER